MSDHARNDDLVAIDPRFCGPPDSGNGGYTCGLVADVLDTDSAEVTLRKPPPLGRPLRIEPSGDGIALFDLDEMVCDGRPAEPGVDLPAPVGADEAREAADRFDVSTYARDHVFPTCFTCGPARTEGDGLRLFPARAPSVENMVVWPWTPGTSLIDDTGRVSAATMWAALDCPSGLAWITSLQPKGPAVLGRMTASIHRRPAAGEPLVVGGWQITADGRKLRAGSAIWSAEGEVLARNVATWILLEKDQQAAFRVASSPPKA